MHIIFPCTWHSTSAFILINFIHLIALKFRSVPLIQGIFCKFRCSSSISNALFVTPIISSNATILVLIFSSLLFSPLWADNITCFCFCSSIIKELSNVKKGYMPLRLIDLNVYTSIKPLRFTRCLHIINLFVKK